MRLRKTLKNADFYRHDCINVSTLLNTLNFKKISKFREKFLYRPLTIRV